MRILVLTYASSNCAGLQRLGASLSQQHWDYRVLGLGDPWPTEPPFPFGRKLVAVREALPKPRQGYTHILFTDGFDTVATQGPTTVAALWQRLQQQQECELLLSCERACWPNPDWAERYPPSSSPWCYVNSGGWLATVDCARAVLAGATEELDDQGYLTEVYLASHTLAAHRVDRDDRCQIFQSVAHCAPWSDFFAQTPDGPGNRITGSTPAFWHGNGRTSLDWLTEEKH